MHNGHTIFIHLLHLLGMKIYTFLNPRQNDQEWNDISSDPSLSLSLSLCKKKKSPEETEEDHDKAQS